MGENVSVRKNLRSHPHAHAMKISPVIVALDFSDQKSADIFISKITPELCSLKIGNELFTKLGPNYVRALIQKNFRVFLDLKFHDIPNTVSNACTAAAELGVWMLNVHVLGGVEMMRAARRAVDVFSAANRPLLIGVTVLTSLDENDLALFGMQHSVENTVLHFAQTAKACGLDGVVCSAKEAVLLRKKLGKDFLLITPGIRFVENNIADQKRVTTPQKAFDAGSDYLVMGRSITDAKDPAKLLRDICALSKKTRYCSKFNSL